MGSRARARGWFALVVGLSIVAGACSSPRPGGGSASAGRTVPSSGCSSSGTATRSGPAVTEQNETVSVDGVTRGYLLTTPPTRPGAAPLPVVVDIHGLAESAQIQALTTQFSAKADKDGFIVVYPEGTGAPVGWDTDSTTHPNHDIDFMNDLLDSLETTFCVDTSRVYATGLSLGAWFTSLLACTMANRFAAFAPVAGVLFDTPCHPGRRVAIVAFHGTADPILYFNGGVGTTALKNALSGAGSSVALPPVDLHGKGYPAAAADWAAYDGCNPASTDRHVSTHVILRTYRCPAGAAVEFYIILGGGHAWPGSTFSAATAKITGPSTFEINATDIIWRFFEQHRLS